MSNYHIPESEWMSPGHLACQGCGATQAMRFALKALGDETVMVMPACCWSVIDGPFPHSAVRIPIFHTAFETAASTASGVKAGLEARGDHTTNVVAWAGDGGTFDIGLQALSGAAERNENIIYVCYDNEAYMNTGIQRSSATPYAAWTTTTPYPNPKHRPKKRILEILAAHEIPYIASSTVAFPNDLERKFERARQIEGMKFIHIFAPCPTGWKSPPELGVELARLAVYSHLFPMVEVVNGRQYSIWKDFEQVPVKEYLSKQGRFAQLTDEAMEYIQKDVDEHWDALVMREAASPLVS